MESTLEVGSGVGNNTVVETTKKPISFLDVCRATLETVGFYRIQQGRQLSHPLAAEYALVGMKVAFPEHFSNRNLKNNRNLDFFNYLIYLGMTLNDVVDMNPAFRREHNHGVLERTFKNWKGAYRGTERKATGIPEKEMIVRDYQRENLALEKLARGIPEDQWTFERVLRYKELSNAIATVYQSAALLGAVALPRRLSTIDKGGLSWQALEQKYAWIINGQPQTDIEIKLCGSWNLVMIAQVIDDWDDLKVDQRLGLHTIAIEAMKSTGNNRVEAEKNIQSALQKYTLGAQQFGFTRGAVKGAEIASRGIKWVMGRFPRVGGFRENVMSKIK